MASIINNGTFTFAPEEVNDLSQVIHELTWTDKQLTDIHDVVEGIKHDKQIVFAGNMGLFGKKLTSCTPSEAEGFVLTNKFWTPVKEDFRITQCSADVNEQDKLVNQFSRVNPDFYNIIEGSQSVVGNFVIMKVTRELPKNIMTKVWFNDTDADVIAEGGNFTAGTDLELFNSFDGLFKQIFADATIPRFTITKNEAASYALQELTGTDAKAILDGIWKIADTRLKKDPDAKILVTSSVWDAYENYLSDVQIAGAGNTMIIEDGKTMLTYKGREVVDMNLWDRVIEEHQNTGVKYVMPHRAVFTVKRNIPIGTTSVSDLTELEVFYERVSKKNYIDGAYTIDAKHLEAYLTVKAY
jgi:hypothetical protein